MNGAFLIFKNMDSASPFRIHILNVDFYFLMCLYNSFETLKHNTLKVDHIKSRSCSIQKISKW
jgi:hypothetical protein